MQFLRPLAVLVSLAAHAALAAAFITAEPAMTAFDQGSGTDSFSTELTITLDGSSMLGGAEEIVEAVDIAPVQQVTAADPVETKEPELKDIITSSEATAEAPMEITEAKPIEEEQPQEVTMQQVAPMVAAEQQNVGSKLSGSDVSARRLYMGEVAKKLQRNKVNPRSTQTGTVVLGFTLDQRGEILSRTVVQSSGSKLLDDAALASLERAAPFPPLPGEAFNGSLELQVPFRFLTR
ncbi:MAG: TonB family protein [Hyphomicrobium sp.]|jgi:protein TonB